MMDSADRFVWIFGGALFMAAGFAAAFLIPSDLTPILCAGLGGISGILIAIGTNG